MPAKKDIIKNLRTEITDLRAEMKKYKSGMKEREWWFEREQITWKIELAIINRQT